MTDDDQPFPDCDGYECEHGDCATACPRNGWQRVPGLADAADIGDDIEIGVDVLLRPVATSRGMAIQVYRRERR